MVFSHVLSQPPAGPAAHHRTSVCAPNCCQPVSPPAARPMDTLTPPLAACLSSVAARAGAGREAEAVGVEAVSWAVIAVVTGPSRASPASVRVVYGQAQAAPLRNRPPRRPHRQRTHKYLSSTFTQQSMSSPPTRPRIHGSVCAKKYAITTRRRAWIFCSARFSASPPPCVRKRGHRPVTT